MLCSDAPSVRWVRGAGWCGALGLVVVAVAWTARAEEDGPHACDAAEGPGCEAPSLPASSVTPRGAVLFVWPALKEPLYGDADAAPWRDALGRVRAGRAPDAGPRSEPRSEAALFLAADLTLLRAAAGGGDYESAATAYEHALREAPDFADAARAWFLLGQAELALGFTPEAGAAFRELVRRFPASPLLDDARLGQAAALRLRRRPREARRIVEAVLAHACGQVRCRAALEAAAETRAADTPAAAADAYRGVAGTCPELRALPGFPLDYAEALALAGDVDGARRVLAHAGHMPRAADDEARLRLLAGRLAADAAGARAEYEQALAQRPAPALAVEAKMRLALLEAERTPERTVQALADLAATPAPHALRAVVLGEAAEVAASAGRFEQALALLARAAALGPEGAAQAAGRRAEILARWLAALDAQGDAAGVATVYAAYTTEVEESAAPAGRATVAHALGRLGLHRAAFRVLGARADGPREPAVAVTLAEEAFASGDLGSARKLLARLEASGLRPDLAERTHRLGARVALAAGDLERAAAEATAADDLGVRAEVATALLGAPGGAAQASALLQAAPAPPASVLLTAAAAAAAEGAWNTAADTYARALAAGATAPERMRAAAGLVRIAHARGEPARATAALAALRATDDDLARRVGRALEKRGAGHGS